MIAYLTGRLVSVSNDEVILDVNGVGYQLFLSKNDVAALMGIEGQVTSLYVDTHVREDHIHLYGFLTAESKAWFRRLNSVSGVGARTAQAILSACPPARLVGAIAAGDHKALTAADGVGPKLAQRLVVELADKLPKNTTPVTRTPADSKITPIKKVDDEATETPLDTSIIEDCVSALVNLGYDRTHAHTTCTRLVYVSERTLEFDTLLRTALQEMAA